MLSIHPNYLNNLVKKSNSITAKQTIQNRILLESKFLLHSTDLSIKEIAYELGFGDPPGFYRFFFRSQQISPLAYRKQAV
jgi:AraC family transcriptional activator of pobA